MKIAVLSHRGGNIGHDFMAAGIEVIVREAFGPAAALTHFEQHHHFSVYPRFHPLRAIDCVSHSRLTALRRFLGTEGARRWLFRQTSPLDFNLAVAAGGPNVVRGGGHTPALRLMLLHFNGAFHYRGVPLVDAGVGACFPLEANDYRLTDAEDRKFYKEAAELAAAVVTREPVAQQVFADLGVETSVVPCAAIASGVVMSEAAAGVEPDQYILVNFQRLGANEDWGQGVDPVKWRDTMRQAIATLERRMPVMLLAQSGPEAELAADLAPHLRCFWPKTVEEYAAAISGACIGIVSRIHAAIALAGIGVPSFVVGTDTRLKTVETMGLETAFVKNVSADLLVDASLRLIERKRQEKERLIALRGSTIRQYVDIFHQYAR